MYDLAGVLAAQISRTQNFSLLMATELDQKLYTLTEDEKNTGGNLEPAKFGTARFGTTKVCHSILRPVALSLGAIVSALGMHIPLCPHSLLCRDPLAGSEINSNHPQAHRK